MCAPWVATIAVRFLVGLLVLLNDDKSGYGKRFSLCSQNRQAVLCRMETNWLALDYSVLLAALCCSVYFADR